MREAEACAHDEVDALEARQQAAADLRLAHGREMASLGAPPLVAQVPVEFDEAEKGAVNAEAGAPRVARGVVIGQRRTRPEAS